MLTLVTDSTAGLSRGEAQHLGVRVVPMTYICDGRRFKEGFQGENEDYSSLLRHSHTITTEPPTSQDFATLFQELTDAGSEVLCCPLSSRLSATYRAAQEAAHSMSQVSVVDSWSTAGTLEILLRYARRLSEQGASRAHIVEELERLREEVRIVFSVPDMGTLRESGRLGALRQALTSTLNHRPIMELSQGTVREVGRAHGSLALARELVEQVPKQARELLLVHCGQRTADMRYTLLAIKRLLPHSRVRIKDGGPALTINLGEGAIALTWEPLHH